MAFATKTLRDDTIPTGAGSAGGLVVVRLDHAGDSATTAAAVDASGLSGHANGAKLDITRVWWSLVQGTADDNTGHVQIQFKGASSDTIALQLAGTGHYDGTAGRITNNATNTTATSGDLELTALGTSGSVIIELRKDGSFTA